MENINCYCDSSFDPSTHIAVVGWKIGDVIEFVLATKTTNTRAEITGLIETIIYLEPDLPYTIYTDCQSVLNRIKNKDKLIEKNFMNKKGIKLSNADLYQELFALLQPNIKFEYIKGHLPSNQMNEHNMHFSQLDKLVRKELRKYLRLDI